MDNAGTPPISQLQRVMGGFDDGMLDGGRDDDDMENINANNFEFSSPGLTASTNPTSPVDVHDPGARFDAAPPSAAAAARGPATLDDIVDVAERVRQLLVALGPIDRLNNTDAAELSELQVALKHFCPPGSGSASDAQLARMEHERIMRRLGKATWFDISGSARFRATLLVEWQLIAHLFNDQFFPGEDYKGQCKRLLHFVDLSLARMDDAPDDLREYAFRLGQKHFAYGVGREHFELLGQLVVRTASLAMGLMMTENLVEALEYCFGTLVDGMMAGATSLREATESAALFSNRNMLTRLKQWQELVSRAMSVPTQQQQQQQQSNMYQLNNGFDSKNNSLAASTNAGRLSLNASLVSGSLPHAVPDGPTTPTTRNSLHPAFTSTVNNNAPLISHYGGSNTNLRAATPIPLTLNGSPLPGSQSRENFAVSPNTSLTSNGSQWSPARLQSLVSRLCDAAVGSAIPAMHTSVNESPEEVSDCQRAASLALAELLTTCAADAREATTGGPDAALAAACTHRAGDFLLYLRKASEATMTDDEFLNTMTGTVRERILNSFATATLHATALSASVGNVLPTASGSSNSVLTGGTSASTGGAGAAGVVTGGALGAGGAGNSAASSSTSSGSSNPHVAQRTVCLWYLNIIQRNLAHAMRDFAKSKRFAPLAGPMAVLEVRFEGLAQLSAAAPTVVARAVDRVYTLVRGLLNMYECVEAHADLERIRVVSVFVTNAVSLAAHLLVAMCDDAPPPALQNIVRGQTFRGTGACFANGNLRARVGIHWAKAPELALVGVVRPSLLVYRGGALAHVAAVAAQAAGGQIVTSAAANHRLGSEMRTAPGLHAAPTLNSAVVPTRVKQDKRFRYTVRLTQGRAPRDERTAEVVPDVMRDTVFATDSATAAATATASGLTMTGAMSSLCMSASTVEPGSVMLPRVDAASAESSFSGQPLMWGGGGSLSPP